MYNTESTISSSELRVRRAPIIIRLSEVDVQVVTMSCSVKKESDDYMVMLKNNEQGQTNDDVWLYLPTKVTREANTMNPHPEQVTFI